MTPKEKAEELIEKIKNELSWIESDYKVDLYRDIKQCAIIAVDEVVRAVPMYTGNLNPTWKFYNEVKEEIQKV